MKKLFVLGFIMILGFVFVGCDNSAPAANQLNATQQTEKVFTLEELSQYTGANGSTAYIAVDGVVYDVTDAFDNGMHQGFQLGGTDATLIFAVSPHSQSLLDTLPVVGTLATDTTTTTTETTTTVTTGSTTTGSTTTSITTTEATTQTTLPVFTLEELSQYTGANGSTAYIAVDGVIYDVTNVFVNGTHQGLQLGGTDATAAFASSPHSMSLLATLTIVGSLEGYDPIVVSGDTTTTNTGTTTNYDDDDDEYDDDYDDDDDDEYEDEHEDEHEDEDEYEYEDDGYELDD